MKYKNLCFSLCLVVFLWSCKEEKRYSYSFYHWKSKVRISPDEDKMLKEANVETIYMRYFDIDFIENNEYNYDDDDSVYPISVLAEVDAEAKAYNIVPVIFITNKALKQKRNLTDLSNKIYKLVNQISEQHFNKIHKTIQVDCDWNESTRDKYFNLIKLLKAHYPNISVTIRLHQIKYKDKTGVPPTDAGVLMLYNVGDLKDFDQNSILESHIVEQYINTQTSYPLALDIALPLFSQTVIKNNDNKIKLINEVDRNSLNSNSSIFQQMTENTYKVKSDTLFKGFYLYEGFSLKTEEVSVDEIVKSFKKIENSSIEINEVLFYHLDSACMNRSKFHELTTKL